MKKIKQFNIFSNFFKNFSENNSFQCRLIRREVINPKYIFTRFKFTDKNQFNFKPGMHVKLISSLKSQDETVLLSKKYTPISYDNCEGAFDLLIKIYRPNKEYPEGGRVSQWIENIKEEDIINVDGPYGKIVYNGNGEFLFNVHGNNVNIVQDLTNWERRRYNDVVMLCGGSGITPMYQEDIVYKTQIDELSKHLNLKTMFYVQNLKVRFDKKDENNSSYKKGLIDCTGLKEIMPSPETNPLILICGRPDMARNYLPTKLSLLGYNEKDIFGF